MAVFYAILMVVGVLTICAVALVVTVYRIVTGWLLTCMEEE